VSAKKLDAKSGVIMHTTTGPRVSNRDVKKTAPEMYKAVSAFGAASREMGLGEELLELVFLRASQLNGCAYCVNMHVEKLAELGVPDQKRELVVVWEEAGIFTEREMAALRWTEVVTLLATTHAPDADWEAVRAVFSEQEVIALTGAIASINTWNRFGAVFRYDLD
jgi:AhpD family alkylhydroperoxidase